MSRRVWQKKIFMCYIGTKEKLIYQFQGGRNGRKILVIGGVAWDPKAAARRCRRLMPDASITMIDENEFISYGGCGIPYFVSGEVQNVDALRQTNADEIRDPAFFPSPSKNIDVRSIQGRSRLIGPKRVSLSKISKPARKRNSAWPTSLSLRPAPPRACRQFLAPTLKACIPAYPPGSGVRPFAMPAKPAPRVNGAVIVGGGFIGLESGRCPGRYVGA